MALFPTRTKPGKNDTGTTAATDWKTDPGLVELQARLVALKAKREGLAPQVVHADTELKSAERAWHRADLEHTAGRLSDTDRKTAQASVDAARKHAAIVRLDLEDTDAKIALTEADIVIATSVARSASFDAHKAKQRDLVRKLDEALAKASAINNELIQFHADVYRRFPAMGPDSAPTAMSFVNFSWPELDTRESDGFVSPRSKYREWHRQIQRAGLLPADGQ